MRLGSKVVLFVADFLPLFVILDILYFFNHYRLFLFLVSFLSALCYVFWYSLLHNGHDVYTYTIQEVTELGNQYVNYIISYVGVLVPLLVLHGYQGIAVFVVVFLLIFTAYVNSDVLFYNPILSIFSYHFYEVKLREVGQVRVISKRPIKIETTVIMKLMVQGTYVAG
jgi:hypothetical protein